MNDTIKLNERQNQILELLSDSDIPLGRDDIETRIDASKPTIIRDLNTLAKAGLVRKTGSGSATAYLLASPNPLLKYIDADDYYDTMYLHRDLAAQSDDTFLDLLAKHDFLSSLEQNQLSEINQNFVSRRDEMPPDGLRRDIERFTIELAWKSSAIEGNTYDIFETEELIKHLRAADGKTVPETLMVLNHKKALDTIIEHRRDYKNIRLTDILDIHAALVGGLDVETGIRTRQVRITNTKYAPTDNQFQLREKMERIVDIVNNKKHPVEKALILSGMIAYLQPFMDGNKRTSRLAANAILLGNNYSALSYRAVNEIDYKKAVLLIDEQHNFHWYKKLFIDQFVDAAENYFAI
jgi:Fic family protein